MPFSKELAPHFYRPNEQWVSRYFRMEEMDRRVLGDPENQIVRKGGADFFTRLGEEIVGTCALKPDTPGVFELSKMGVDERYQGRGIGRQLLEAAIAEFGRLGGGELFLETDSILGPALTLYESVGFERQAAPRPGSLYERSNVYMIWKPPSP